jgi:hypothetical protein
MSYKVKTDGSVETDTAEEALRLMLLFQKHEFDDVTASPAAPVITGSNGAHKPAAKKKTRRGSRKGVKLGPRRPEAARLHGIKLGQVWEQYGTGKVIQIAQLMDDGLMPKTIKKAKGKMHSMDKKIGYKSLKDRYKLKKNA